MKKWGTKPWFIFTSVFAFASLLSFFQINSYWADQHNFNGLFGWLGLGILFGIIAIFGIYKTSKHSL